MSDCLTHPFLRYVKTCALLDYVFGGSTLSQRTMIGSPSLLWALCLEVHPPFAKLFNKSHAHIARTLLSSSKYIE
ncbi:hypothetical protein ACQRIU_005481 [Beauveria bassiana]